MKWLGDKPLHTLLMLTEKPGEWAAWQVTPVPLALAAGSGVLWAAATKDPAWGWAVGLGSLAFALADWSLLAALRRRGMSFGAVQPVFLGLVGLRWFIAVVGVPLAAHWPLSALIALLLCQVLLSGLMIYGTVIEPFRLQTTYVDITSPKLSNPGTHLRIVHLSDLHVERLSPRERALPPLVAGLKPDLIVLTGDFLSTSYNDDPQALADLGALLGQLHASGGVYAVWGTVEVDRPDLLRPVLEEQGIVVLENRAVEVAVGGHRLRIIGVSCSRDLAADATRLRSLQVQAPDLTHHRGTSRCAPTKCAPAGCAPTGCDPTEDFSLLLYHTPDLMPQAASLGIDLYLAGHTHGGQWRLPGFGAILTSSRFWKRYESGHYREGNTHLYVSRGLGMEGFGAPRARFFCPPEVAILQLSGAAGDSREDRTAGQTREP